MTRLGFVRKIIINRHGDKPSAIAWALLTVGSALLLRLLLSPWVEGVPFLTFFPAVLLSALALGWRWGGLVLLASALVANYMFQPPNMALAFGAAELTADAGFLLFGGLVVSAAEALRRSVIEVDERSRKERALNMELQHRVNNTLTVVQALAQQMVRHAETPDAFYGAFSERLQAIADANKILSHGDFDVVLMPDLAEAALRPFRGRGDIELDGEPCRLPARSTVPLVLALHELATNAAKYGALSTPDGLVRLQWRVVGEDCLITWVEEGGPPVAPPTRRGLGSRLLRRQPGLTAVAVEYEPKGVVCEVTVEGAAPFSLA
ncbi:DUF4118 domain-containing protein [Phenylobacterium sp. LjRoot164]|uniref:sensor histidine kinase n=1 Tax=unclassified Phenylobacterium TaxID=2640670 RepID=UPI003ECD348F